MSRVSFWSSVVMPWTKTVYDGLTCIIHGLCIITMGSMACSDHSEAFMAVCPRIWKNRGRGLKFLLLPLQDRRCSERVSGCLLEKNLNIWKIKELGYKSVVLPFFFFFNKQYRKLSESSVPDLKGEQRPTLALASLSEAATNTLGKKWKPLY